MAAVWPGGSAPCEARLRRNETMRRRDRIHNTWIQMDHIDKMLSAVLFNLQIGMRAELILSVPGCAFGMPAALVLLGALLLRPLNPHILLLCTALSTALGLLWSRLLFGDKGSRLNPATAFRLLYSHYFALAAPLLVNLTAYATKTDAHAANYYFLTWLISIAIALPIKKASQRPRPIVSKLGPNREAIVAPKALKIIQKILMRDVYGSFPSGDVTGATSFGFVLWRCYDLPACAMGCIMLSASGRM